MSDLNGRESREPFQLWLARDAFKVNDWVWNRKPTTRELWLPSQIQAVIRDINGRVFNRIKGNLFGHTPTVQKRVFKRENPVYCKFPEAHSDIHFGDVILASMRNGTPAIQMTMIGGDRGTWCDHCHVCTVVHDCYVKERTDAHRIALAGESRLNPDAPCATLDQTCRGRESCFALSRDRFQTERAPPRRPRVDLDERAQGRGTVRIPRGERAQQARHSGRRRPGPAHAPGCRARPAAAGSRARRAHGRGSAAGARARSTTRASRRSRSSDTPPSTASRQSVSEPPRPRLPASPASSPMRAAACAKRPTSPSPACGRAGARVTAWRDH